MNNNDILSIAKSLYLQEVISRQLFAKFNSELPINELSGSFARPSENLFAKFSPFIGFPPNKNNFQIVEKHGTDFTIYAFNTNGVIDKSISHNVRGWDNLAQYFTAVSSQIVAPGKSFHALLKGLIQKVNIDDIAKKYAPSSKDQDSYFQAVREDIKQNNGITDEQKINQEASKRVADWRMRKILLNWRDDVIKSLNIVIVLAKNIHAFTISNQIDSIVASLISLSQEISNKIDKYLADNLNKLIDHNMVESTVIKTIQSYIQSNNDVLQLLNLGQQNATTISSKKISNVSQNIDQLQQIVQFLQDNQDNQFASALLDAINNSNDGNSLINNCNAIQIEYDGDVINFDCTKNLKGELEKFNLAGYQKNLQKDGEQAGNWKAKILPFVRFVKGIGKGYFGFNSWTNIYKLYTARFKNSINELSLIEKVNVFFNTAQVNVNSVETQRKKYLSNVKVYRAVLSGKQQVTNLSLREKQQYQLAQEAVNKLEQIFANVSQGKTIVNNMLNKDEQIFNQYGCRSRFIQGIARNAKASIPYTWFENTDMLKQLVRLVDAN